ncbi:MAG: hypothetical protein KGH98_02005 [Candidatus Micrarchaeota archaeon]|nr:hypothetical protein [Candidatus Micrarchaeota archaeon]
MPSNRTLVNIRKGVGMANLALGTAVVALDALLRQDISHVLRDQSQSLYVTFAMGGGGAALAVSGALQYFGKFMRRTGSESQS